MCGGRLFPLLALLLMGQSESKGLGVDALADDLLGATPCTPRTLIRRSTTTASILISPERGARRGPGSTPLTGGPPTIGASGRLSMWRGGATAWRRNNEKG